MMKNRVQLLNPRSKRYVLVDTSTGEVLRTKRTPGPYRNVEIKTRLKTVQGIFPTRTIKDPPNVKTTVDVESVKHAIKKAAANRKREIE